MDLDHIHLKAQSKGKWVRLLRPTHTKGRHNSVAILGKRSPLNPLESFIPTKHRVCADAAQDENCPPTAKAVLQPRQEDELALLEYVWAWKPGHSSRA